MIPRSWIVNVFIAAGVACGSAGAAPAGHSRASADGSAVFRVHCAPCHGMEGKGKPRIGTPNFTDPKVQASITDEQIVTTIKNGRKGTAMPTWSGKLAEEEINAVAAYIRTFGSQGSTQANRR